MGYELMHAPEGLQEAEMLREPGSMEQLEEGVIRERLGMHEELTEWNEAQEKIIGNPEEADDHWHEQSEQNSCAVACQEFVAEQLLDREFSERELIEYAKERDWYDSAEGTSVTDVGKLLEAMGLEVERAEGLTIAELAQSLAEGEKVICGVNNMILQEPSLAGLPGISANHAVELIGIDYSDPIKPQVILNDPGVRNGRGIRHDMGVFLEAWETSNRFVVTANKKEAV